jgi:hypothetical protein
VLLRIEEEDPKENEYESLFPNKAFKRKHAPDDDSGRQSGAWSDAPERTMTPGLML